MTDTPSPGWLVLIHQIPPKPAYLRVKIGRRLARVGAVAIKNSVYVLPRGESRMEDFQWIRREVLAGGGEAAILEAQLLDGLSDQEVEQLFRAERGARAAARGSDAAPGTAAGGYRGARFFWCCGTRGGRRSGAGAAQCAAS